jgi:hypothetical protein
MQTARSISHFLYVAVASAALMLTASVRAEAQLRPLDPTDFRALEDQQLRVYVGAGVYFSQHASLAGVRGRLLELGDLRVSWRSGRILVEVAGTVQRFLREDTVVMAPADGVAASSADGSRRDAGDYRVQTILRLTGDTAQTEAILRFGTRLPTTDNRVGLERDQTDFFASVGAARAFGAVHLMAEAGIGINGTRLSNYEQSDVMIYAATMEYRAGLFAPFVSVVGQNDMHIRAVRGNEDLGELRAGLRIGRAWWLNATAIHGFHDSSPRSGLVIGAGASFGGKR